MSCICMPIKCHTMPKILELDIVLKDVKPKMWRRILIPDNKSFHELHFAIQFAMGWSGEHLYHFIVGRFIRFIGYRLEDGSDPDVLENARTVAISTLLNSPEDSILYQYDFGDCWEHQVTVRNIHPKEKGRKYPVLVAGARACPPEDVGGILGYSELLYAMKKKDSEDYKMFVDWLGGPFDPKEFDKDSINSRYFGNFKAEMVRKEKKYYRKSLQGRRTPGL